MTCANASTRVAETNPSLRGTSGSLQPTRRPPEALPVFLAAFGLASCAERGTSLLVDPEAVRDHCDRYVAILSERLVECYGGDVEYRRRNIVLPICPPYILGRDEVALEVGAATECIELLRTWDCGQNLPFVCPGVVGVGIDGDECSTDIGCAPDYECSRGCGRCRKIPAGQAHGRRCSESAGSAACSDDDRCTAYSSAGRSYCSHAPGAACTSSSGFCGPDASCYDGQCRPLADVGRDCMADTDCAGYLECLEIPSGLRRCMLGARFGTSCGDSRRYCAGGAGVCDDVSGICSQFPADGFPCLSDGACETQSTCDYEGTGLCRAPPALGEACDNDWLWCADGECTRGICRETCGG